MLEMPLRTLTDSDIEAIVESLATAQAIAVPNIFLPPKDVIKYLPVFLTAGGIRNAVRNGEFKSGSEVQKHGGRLGINPRAYLARKEREQKKVRIC